MFVCSLDQLNGRKRNLCDWLTVHLDMRCLWAENAERGNDEVKWILQLRCGPGMAIRKVEGATLKETLNL
jgi:hypothetical protein